MVFSLRREKEALDTRAKLHCARRLANVVVSLFEGAHPCNAVTPRPRFRNPQAAKSPAARQFHRHGKFRQKMRRDCGSCYDEDMNFWIGTSGFQYTEWREVFYPAKLPAAKMLPFYAERFQTTEINYTFRRIPSGKTIESWYELTPEQFAFSLKAPQRITHFAKLQNCAESLNYFFGVIQGLEQKLGPLLFQLPPSFKKDAQVLNAFLEELPRWHSRRVRVSSRLMVRR